MRATYRKLDVEKLHSNPAWDEIQRAFFTTGAARPVLSGLSELIEQIALRAYEASFVKSNSPDLAMLAVGGFGRRELFPYSDVDILILMEREAQIAALTEPLADFVRLMWDAGMRLSHTVRTVAECAEIHEGNIELSISLLDRRLLVGSSDVVAKLESKLPVFFERQAAQLEPAPLPAGPRPARQVSRHVLSPGAGRERNTRRFARCAPDRVAGEIARGQIGSGRPPGRARALSRVAALLPALPGAIEIRIC